MFKKERMLSLLHLVANWQHFTVNRSDSHHNAAEVENFSLL